MSTFYPVSHLMGDASVTPEQRRARATHWHTQDGRSLEIRDMDQSHLENTISFLMRKIDSLIVYEMGAATGADPFSLEFDEFKYLWWYLSKMREELARRGFQEKL